MFDSDWRPNLAIGALAAVIVFACFALAEYHASRSPPRQPIAEMSAAEYKQQTDCQPDNSSYYNCRDLIAQDGVRVATDRLVLQGSWQFWLGVVNLALLVATLAASIVATLIGVQAVKVSRQEMENGLQPRLGCNIPTQNWNPDADPANVDPLGDLLGSTDPDVTTITFHNYGEASAFLVMLHYKHYWRDEKDGFPPPLEHPWEVKNWHTLMEGNWVKKYDNTQDFTAEPWSDIAGDQSPTTNKRCWYLMGFVAYEGLQGVRYLTRFCWYWSSKDKAWYLGPADLRRDQYNRSEKLDKEWAKDVEWARLMKSLHD